MFQYFPQMATMLIKCNESIERWRKGGKLSHYSIMKHHSAAALTFYINDEQLMNNLHTGGSAPGGVAYCCIGGAEGGG